MKLIIIQEILLPPKLFVREATGLVRELGGFDSFLLDLSIINPTAAFGYAALAIFFFPGASLGFAMALAIVPALGMFIVYSMLASAFPRAGGDYVYVSRLLHPALGVATGMAYVFVLVIFFVTALWPWIMVTSGLPALLTSLSFVTGDVAYAGAAEFISTQKVLAFILSSLILLAGSAVALLGMRIFRWVMRVGYAYYFLVTAVYVVVLFATSRQAFISSLDALTASGAYQQVLTNAGEYGTYNFSWFQTFLAFVPIGFLAFTGWQGTTYVGGEVRNPSKTQSLALGLSLLLAWIFLVLVGFQSSVVFGDDFLQAVSYLWATDPSKIPFHAAPFVSFLVSIPYRSVPLTLLLNSIPLVGGFLIIPSALLAASRIFFAQAFDRILPQWIAKVNDRVHSPVNSVLVLIVLSELWIVVLYFFGFITSLLTVQLVLPLAWGVVAVAAISFPYAKREMYERVTSALPRWMQAKPLGVPLLVIGGLVQLLAMLIWIGSLFSPVVSYLYLGPAVISAVGVALGVYVFSLVGYYGVRAYRIGHDKVDIALAFREIPPE